MFDKPKDMFTNLLNGILKLFFNFPDNFKNATIEPVVVIPPIKLPKYCDAIWTKWGVVICIKLESDVAVAAKPTKEWNSATVCGKLTGFTLSPTNVPKYPPIAISTVDCTKSGVVQSHANKVVVIPVEIPTYPNEFPIPAVFCFDKPAIAAMQDKLDIR